MTGREKRPVPSGEYCAEPLRIGVRDAKANLSQLLRDVKDGREVVITEYGRPVARVVPVRDLSLPDWLAEMKSRGEIVSQKAATKDFHPLAVPDGLAQKYLQEDREGGAK